MLNTKFPSWPSYTEEEAEAVKNVLLSNRVNYWTGNECRLFEKEFANWVGCKKAIAVANGTVALELALNAIDIKGGDEVITTSRTFLATASSIVLSGGTPVFADVEIDTQNISAETIKPHITEKTKAIIVVHLAGMPAEMDEIMILAEQHGLFVIEDCAQAHGAQYKGKSVGSIGHIGAWSFCQDKIMTTGGEGGMVTTNDDSLWNKMWSFKDHGKSYQAVYEKEHLPGFRWLHESFGTNWRMTEMQGAIGRIQLGRMDEWTRKREEFASIIDSYINSFAAIRKIEIPEYVVHARYKHYALLDVSNLKDGWTRDRIVDECNRRGAPVYQGSCSEVYLEKAFQETDFKPKQRLPNAVVLGNISLMFLVHPTLGSSNVHEIAKTISAVLADASK